MIPYTVKDVLKVVVQDPFNIPNLTSESGSEMVVPTIKKTNIITLEHRGHPLYLSPGLGPSDFCYYIQGDCFQQDFLLIHLCQVAFH